MATDPLATIVSILKNASTGLNSTGYEIYEDDGTTECTVLVTYALAKETLNALFGGSQDKDVVITVEAGEGSTEWIGLSTQVHHLPVVLTIHVIEKHSAVASGNKIITAPLVIWKVFDILSKFVDANTNAPGGSILTLTQGDHRFEIDDSVRPVMYKCIIELEARVVR